MDRAGLHRLVVEKESVGADPPLPVVDERALVVGAEEDELPVQLEKVVLAEPVDLAVGDGLAVADHAAQTPLGRKHLGHAAESVFRAPFGMTLRRRGVMGEREARAGAVGSRSDAVAAHPRS